LGEECLLNIFIRRRRRAAAGIMYKFKILNRTIIFGVKGTGPFGYLKNINKININTKIKYNKIAFTHFIHQFLRYFSNNSIERNIDAKIAIVKLHCAIKSGAFDISAGKNRKSTITN
jgi:hypothetical protein